MGDFIPVFSGVSGDTLLTPPPEATLVSVSECGRGVSGLRSVQNLIKRSGAKKIYLDNGMYTYYRKWRAGEKVIVDVDRPVYPKGIAMNITPVHDIYYTLNIKPAVTFVTDLPAPDLSSPPDPGEEELNFMLITYHNLLRARQMVAMHEKFCPEVELFYVFQGYTIEHLMRIKTELGNLQFAGYALATRTLKWNKIVAMTVMLYCYGVKKIHILAGSSMPIMAVGAFIARHLMDTLSYDSANWQTFSFKDTFRFFGSMGTVRPMKKLDIPQHILSLRCDCPHCNGRSIADLREMGHGREKQQLLALHNYCAEVETAKALYDHSETPAILRDFLLSKSHRTKLIWEIYEALSAVHEMQDYLHDLKFGKGLAEYIFQRFKAR